MAARVQPLQLLILVCAALLTAGSIPADATMRRTAVAVQVEHDQQALKQRKKRPDETESPRPSRSQRGRNISRTLLVERLPEIAALLGFDADAGPQDNEESSTVNASVESSFDDSELSEDEVAGEEEFSEADYDDINKIYEDFTRYMSALNGTEVITDNGVDKQAMIESIWEWVGTRYRFGGTTRNGIDCSAFTGTVYRSLGKGLPRTAAMQWEAGEPIERDELQYGDLVFFHTRRGVYVSHVGIYLGNDLFAHASSRNGVIVSSLGSRYYDSHYIGARRFEFGGQVADRGANGGGM